MRDPVLAGIVGMAHDQGIELPVTLFVAGSTVEGVVVSEPRWMDRLAEVLEAPGSAGAGSIAQVFREIRMTVELHAITEPGLRDFVHLVDAVVRAGHELQSVGLWRIRVEDVTGWKLGPALPARLRAVEG